MKLIQPLLILLLVVFVLIYLARFRSRLLGRFIVLFVTGLGILMVILPSLADTFAHLLGLVGVGRGGDLITYLGLTGLIFLWLLLYIRLRDLNGQLTMLARAIAINTARSPDGVENKKDDPYFPDHEA